MSISERLQMVIKMNGMTNSTFADKIGVQRSSISHVLAGRNKPSIDFIQKILDAFPKVDANWLVTGRKVGKTIEVESFGAKEKLSHQDTAAVKTLEQSENRASSKHIKKVILLYKDGTYEELIDYPRSQ